MERYCNMLKKIIKYSPITIFGILALLLQTGRVRFGHGLGDIVDHGFIYLGLLLSTFLLIGNENIPRKIFQVLSTLLFVFGIYLFLSMTIWRGGESRWNGRILVQSEENLYQKSYHSQNIKS